MKTFTLRLNEQESEALERLAVVEGKSKNKCITELIAIAFERYEKPGNIINGDIMSLSDVEQWPGVYENIIRHDYESDLAFCKDKDEKDELTLLYKDEIKTLKKIYKYAIKEAKDAAAAEQLEKQQQAFIEAFIKEMIAPYERKSNTVEQKLNTLAEEYLKMKQWEEQKKQMLKQREEQHEAAEAGRITPEIQAEPGK